MLPNAGGLLAPVLYLQCCHFQRNVVHLFGSSNELQAVKGVPIWFQGEFLLFELKMHLDIQVFLYYTTALSSDIYCTILQDNIHVIYQPKLILIARMCLDYDSNYSIPSFFSAMNP